MRLAKKAYSCPSRRIRIILDDPNIFAFLPNYTSMPARCQTFSIVHDIDSFPIDQTQSVNSLKLVLLPKNCLVAAGDDQDIF